MVEVAVISPIAHMRSMGAGRRFHLLLAHLARNRNYVQAVHDMKGYKILDNSLMENGHKAMEMRAVISAAHVLQPDEIVLPDVFCDGRATLDLAAESLAYCTRVGARRRYMVAAVAHGKTAQEWLVCYQGLVALGVDVIHIPKVMDTSWPYGGRAGLVHWLHNTNHRNRFIEHHLLGIWTNPVELASYVYIPWLRSCDTALPIQAAFSNTTLHPLWGLDPLGPKSKRPENYFDLILTDEQHLIADENIRILDNLAKGLLP